MSRYLQVRGQELQADVSPSHPRLLTLENTAHARAAAQEVNAARSNARAVELIASPGRGEQLLACVCKHLVPVLKKRAGFEGAFLMRAHDEPRRIVVVTLWQTHRRATETQWETETAFRRLVASMVDVCTRVQTYEFLPAAGGPTAPARHANGDAFGIHPC